MIREFFCQGHVRQRACAWTGVLVFFAHEGFKAYLKAALNKWYEEFYDTLQLNIERGSGDNDQLSDARAKVASQLSAFVIIVAPAVAIHPLSNLIRNMWIYAWRRALMKTYLRAWTEASTTVEGSAQRVHEDTQRFAAGLQGCVSVLVEALLTLVVFCPILYELDRQLMYTAIATALGGILISAAVGQRLVGLEVNNQKAEAALRTELVLLEQNQTLGATFHVLIDTLTRNYVALYLNFAALSTWLSSFEQFASVLPYLLVASRLFAAREAQVMTLGQLIKVTNSFGKVFDSMNIVSANYLAINEWRSVLRRLSEFEAALGSTLHRADLQINRITTTESHDAKRLLRSVQMEIVPTTSGISEVGDDAKP